MRDSATNIIREQSARIQRILALLAAMMAALISLGIPALVMVVGVLDYRIMLQSELARQLVVASNFLYDKPRIGLDEQLLFRELLGRNIGEDHQLSWLKLTLADGREVARLGAPPDIFSLTQSLPVRDGGKIIGTLSGAVSLRVVLFKAMLSALISVPLAIAVFTALRLGPSRIARLSFARLAEMEGLIAANLAGLNKAQRIAGLGSWEQDFSSPRRRWSEPGLRLYGSTDGNTDTDSWDWLSKIHPDDRGLLRDALDRNARTGEFQKVQYRLQRPDAADLIVEEQIEAIYDSSGAIVGQAGVFQDVTERQSMAAQLAQAVKMEAIGNLTGGLAHDFNNYLAVIIGNLGLAKERQIVDAVMTKLLDNALKGASSGAELTKSLLAFSRKQPLDPRLIDVNQRLEATTLLLKRTLGEDIALTVKLAPDLWPARVDGAQFDSCILNLANNARDAMPNGGSLLFATRNTRLDEDFAKTNPDVTPGDYVVIEVSDTGGGMPPETLARVFEPFFTTKGLRHGTGLGLSMVHGFVKQSEGHIKIYSEVGYGTTIRIYLPRAGNAGVATAVASDARDRTSTLERTETILAVEDNEQMRRTAVAQLGSLGYRVIEADNGQAALAILEQRDRHIDLLFTDIVMPGGMDGYELAKRALERRPGLKVLLTSGFPDGSWRGSCNGTAHLSLLSKPYRKEELDQAIRTALRSESPRPGETP